jgi:UPF0755 protein
LSDDGWFGEPEEPAPGSAYGQGRRAARGRPPQQPQQAGQPGQSGEYAQPGQQYAQPNQYSQQPGQYAQQYPQDPYNSNPYPQDYPAQPQQSYYDELGPRSTPPPGRNTADDWNSASQGQGYGTPQPQAYPQQQQPQTSYPHRGQPQAPSADPYASGSYGSGSYASDAYSSGAYTTPSDPYASDNRYAPPTPTPPQPQTPTDPYGSGTYGRPARDPRGGGYASGAYPTNPGAPTGPQSQPQPQDPYGRRRGPAGAPGVSTAAPGAQSGYGNGYTQYEDDDEFPSRGGRRPAPGYGTDTDRYGSEPGRPGTDPAAADRRAESPSGPRSRRRGAMPDGDDADAHDGRFSLIDEEGDEGDPGSGRGGKQNQKRGRNCLAVFIAFLVIAGGLGYGGYKGVQWYQSKYGPAPDFVSTTGTGSKASINIPTGSGGKTIGGLLFTAGVIKSQRAFTDACNADPKCANIEAGTYILPVGISAAASITDLLDPKNRDSKSQLITYGGERASQIFASLESKTGWADADVRAAIASGKIDLPAWDTGQPGPKTPYAHIEGFIPAESYTITDYKTPTDLLKKMVDDQLAVFSQEDMANKAPKLGLTEYKMLILASLARAEAGSNVNDLNKIAGVVFNRFNNPNQFAHLGFDTSTLYGMGNTGTVPNNKDTTNPYNTSVLGIKGLPPSPIDNPDQPSIDAALNPNRASNYFYFCATPDGVQYASTNEQWQQLGVKYKGLCGSHG